MSASARPPEQPTFPPARVEASPAMRQFIASLPESAFSMTGPLIPGVRGILYSRAESATPASEFWKYVSVTYQLLDEPWGRWRGVIVAFHLPSSGSKSSEETFYVGISLNHWHDTNPLSRFLASQSGSANGVVGGAIGSGRGPFSLPRVWKDQVVNWSQLRGAPMFMSDMSIR